MWWFLFKNGLINSITTLYLKCYFDQILDTHFLHFHTRQVFLKYLAKFQSITNSITGVFLDLYFREFMAAINFPCSKSGLRTGENDVIFSKIPHRLKCKNMDIENLILAVELTNILNTSISLDSLSNSNEIATGEVKSSTWMFCKWSVCSTGSSPSASLPL